MCWMLFENLNWSYMREMILLCAFFWSDMLKGIGDLTYFASNEDDPYVTMKDEVSM